MTANKPKQDDSGLAIRTCDQPITVPPREPFKLTEEEKRMIARAQIDAFTQRILGGQE